jgi:predicted transposase YdaD
MPFGAYISVVLRANGLGLEEMAEMPNVTLEKVLEKHGFIEKWEARGREEGLEKGLERAVKRLRKHGMDPEEIAGALELPLAKVTGYLKAE